MKHVSEFRLRQAIIHCAVVCSLALYSCADDKAQEKALINGQQTGSVESSTATQTRNAATNNSFAKMYRLFMTAKDFKALADKRDKDKRKLMFQFCLSPKYPDVLTLRGWAGKGDEDYDNTKFILDTLKLDTDVYEKEIYFSSQKVPGDDVNAILKDIGTDTTKYVIFDPQPNPSDYHVFYNVFVVTQDQFLRMKTEQPSLAPATLISTNPSPPASSKNSSRG